MQEREEGGGGGQYGARTLSAFCLRVRKAGLEKPTRLFPASSRIMLRTRVNRDPVLLNSRSSLAKCPRPSREHNTKAPEFR